jgi:hypothetical protein
MLRLLTCSREDAAQQDRVSLERRDRDGDVIDHERYVRASTVSGAGTSAEAARTSA